ncbi:MAG: response regulator [Candidatus Obscuribacterales bacterium]|nr:response regulator [Cyanobacteria bacterium HKST-UBA01]MCB9471036.1 response regulator [Candidatus Obscuribacterales bacterium]
MLTKTKILIGDDSEADVTLLLKCMGNTRELGFELLVAGDGEAVLKAIEADHADSESSKVGLILLDLNMPKLSGHDVLRCLKSDPRFKQTPVIIISSSDEQSDIRQAYDNHCNCYIQKPSDLKGFRDLCQIVKSFWFDLVLLPTQV